MKKTVLCEIPDSEAMTREVFLNLIKKYRHYRNLSYGFSTKHTDDIMAYRKSVGVKSDAATIPSNMYGMNVEWNAPTTYIRQG
jgi:hypothetical protein